MSSSFVAPKYEPSAEVVVMHNLYHVNALNSHQPVSNTFDPMNENYLYSVVTLPASILAVGVAAIVLLFIISNCFVPSTCFWKHCWYYICCCCCPNKQKDIDENKAEEKREAWLKASSRASKVCYFVIFCILVGAGFLWLGNAELSQGMKDAVDGVTLLQSILEGVMNAAAGSTDSVAFYSQNLINAIASTNCTSNPALSNAGAAATVASINDAAANAFNSGNRINGRANLVKLAANILGNQINTAFLYKDKYIVYVFIGLLVICLFNFITVWKKSRYVSFFVSIFNFVIMIVLLVVCSVSMIAVMFLSDFCFDPAASLKTIEGGASSIIEYYSTCVGDNPFQNQLNSSSQQVIDLQAYIGSSSSFSNTSLYYYEEAADGITCGPLASSSYAGVDCHLCSQSLSTPVTGISGKVTDVTDQLDCESIYRMYDQLVNTALCKTSYAGLYKVWADLYFIALFLFILICCISKLYQYMIGDVEVKKPWIKPHYKLVANDPNAAQQLTDAEIELGNMSTVGGVGIVNIL